MSQSTLSPPPPQFDDDHVRAIDELGELYSRLRNELGRVIVGQHEVIERLAICLFARGHALLMGVPGLAKTLLVSKLAETMSLKFSRIQFTPDLMPMDITGTDILQDGARRPARVPVRARAGVREHRPGRRDQPRPAEDAGGDARSHAGAAGDGDRQDVRPRAAVSRAGHAESRSSRKARIRCPRHSSTASCS